MIISSDIIVGKSYQIKLQQLELKWHYHHESQPLGLPQRNLLDDCLINPYLLNHIIHIDIGVNQTKKRGIQGINWRQEWFSRVTVGLLHGT